MSRWPGMLFHFHDSSPCYGCADRTVGCHGKCERHSEWKQKRDSDMGERIEAAKGRNILDDFAADSMKRCRR